MLKIFDIHWKDGKVERIIGESLAKAFSEAYGSRATAIIDYFEEKKSVPNNEKILFIDKDTFCNSLFIKIFRENADCKVGEIIEIRLSNKIFKYIVDEITETEIYYKTISKEKEKIKC